MAKHPPSYEDAKQRLLREADHYRRLAADVKGRLHEDRLDIVKVAEFFVKQLKEKGKAPDPVPIPMTLERMASKLSMSPIDTAARIKDVIVATHCNFQLYDFHMSNGYPG